MQDIEYSEALNAYRTVIHTPFWKASFMLGWPIESAGFGVNKILVGKCLNRGADLIVFSEFDQKEYRLDHHTLVELCSKWNCDYYKGTELKILPVNMFAPFVQQDAETCKCHCGCNTVVQAGYFLCPKCVQRCLQ